MTVGGLTPEEKARHLAYWDETRADLSDITSPGTPDPDVFPLVDALNAMPGVCTVQSCAGHRSPEPKSFDTRDRGDGFTSGQLWLRVSDAVLVLLQARLAELLAEPSIEQVSLLYGRTERSPVVDIVFHGNERGMLPEASRAILSYFQSLLPTPEGAPTSR